MATAAPASRSSSQSAADASFAKGLEGIVAGETSLGSIEQGGLFYRGYEIHDLSQNATFEEVAFLLLEGHKPSKDELKRLFGRKVKVTISGPADASSGIISVSPKQAVVVKTHFDLTLSVGG